MSNPDGPVTSPEQPEPDQSAPTPPAAAPVPPPVVPAPVAYAAPPAPPAAKTHGTGFTILVSAITALVVAVVVAAGTAFGVSKLGDRDWRHDRGGKSQSCVVDKMQRSDQSGREWVQPGGSDSGSQGRRGMMPDGPGTTSVPVPTPAPGSTDGSGSTDQGQ